MNRAWHIYDHDVSLAEDGWCYYPPLVSDKAVLGVIESLAEYQWFCPMLF